MPVLFYDIALFEKTEKFNGLSLKFAVHSTIMPPWKNNGSKIMNSPKLQ